MSTVVGAKVVGWVVGAAVVVWVAKPAAGSQNTRPGSTNQQRTTAVEAWPDCVPTPSDPPCLPMWHRLVKRD